MLALQYTETDTESQRKCYVLKALQPHIGYNSRSAPQIQRTYAREKLKFAIAITAIQRLIVR